MSDRLRISAEAVFAVVAMLACTLGPVYRVTLELGGRGFDFATEPLAISILAVFYVVAAGLGGMAQGRPAWQPFIASVVLATVLLISTTWSVSRYLSASQAVLALATLALPWYLARRWTAQQVVALAWLATSIGIVLSALLLAIGDDLARDGAGNVAGVYFNRNSLGAVSALCAVLGALAAAYGLGFAPGRDGAGRLVAALSVPVAVVFVLWSGSRTALVSVVVVAVFWSAAMLTVRLVRPERTPASLWGLLAVAAAALLAGFRPVASALGSDPTLQGRTEIWSYLRERIIERPLTGDGWLATFTTDDYWYYSRDNLSRVVDTAHNGVLEVAVGAGLIGVAALLVVLWFGVSQGVRTFGDGSMATAITLVVAVFFLVANSAETFVGAHHLVWVLFLSVCAYRWRPAADANAATAADRAAGTQEPQADRR